jgi:hypothetical protein
MKKKICALGMAMAMLFSTSVFATDAPTVGTTEAVTGLSSTLKVDGTAKAPTAVVNVPTSGAILLNPYGLSIGSGDDAVTDSIVSPEYVVSAGASNDVKTSVYVSAATVAKGKTGTVAPVVDVTAYKTAAAKGTKNVLLGLSVAKSVDESGVADYDDVTAVSNPVESADLKGDGVTILGTSYKPATGESGIAIAKDMEASGSGAFKIVGLVNKDVTTAWTDQDTVAVTLTYKIVIGDAITSDAP